MAKSLREIIVEISYAKKRVAEIEKKIADNKKKYNRAKQNEAKAVNRLEQAKEAALKSYAVTEDNRFIDPVTKMDVTNIVMSKINKIKGEIAAYQAEQEDCKSLHKGLKDELDKRQEALDELIALRDAARTVDGSAKFFQREGYPSVGLKSVGNSFLKGTIKVGHFFRDVGLFVGKSFKKLATAIKAKRGDFDLESEYPLHLEQYEDYDEKTRVATIVKAVPGSEDIVEIQFVCGANGLIDWSDPRNKKLLESEEARCAIIENNPYAIVDLPPAFVGKKEAKAFEKSANEYYEEGNYVGYNGNELDEEAFGKQIEGYANKLKKLMKKKGLDL